MKKHLLAGEFGAAARLSPKALRLYAEQGLLIPARVDPATGYRYYAPDQLPRARLIAKLRDELLRELDQWLRNNQVTDAGPFFLQLILIDMGGDMEIEVGAVTPRAGTGDDRVSAGVLPAGRYATLTYRDHAIQANKALLDWARADGLALDADKGGPGGDRFGCRYEAYMTDPRTEPRKTKWEVELAFVGHLGKA